MSFSDSIAKLGTRGIFKKWLWFLARKRPDQIHRALMLRIPRLDLDIVPKQTIEGFEDCTFLFSVNTTNRGILRMDFDEAAHLFKIVRAINSPRIFEIGRLQGGSTLLLAVAAGNGGKIVSVDIEPWDDVTLMNALQMLDCAERVEILTCDANTLPDPPKPYDVIFVDGDHRYDGVRKDFEKWFPHLAPGGHMIFHDASKSRRFATGNADVMRLVDEITHSHSSWLKRLPDVGSLAHFVRV